MKYKIVIKTVVTLASLNFQYFALAASPKNESSKTKIMSQVIHSPGTALYCGYIRPGCEDIATNTVEIKFKSENRVELIRNYHSSDIPITSAFVGNLLDNVVTATFDKLLTERNWRQVQKSLPHGKIAAYLTCADPQKLTNCKINGKATEGSVGQYPGWQVGDLRNAPLDLECNTKEIKMFASPECKIDD